MFLALGSVPVAHGLESQDRLRSADSSTLVAGPLGASPQPARRGADFGAFRPSASAREIADWVVGSGDNEGLPFIIG